MQLGEGLCLNERERETSCLKDVIFCYWLV